MLIFFCFEVKKVSINSSSLTIAYTGTEVVINIPIEQVLTPRPLYNKVGAMAKLNKELYHADLEQQEEIHFYQWMLLFFLLKNYNQIH